MNRINLNVPENVRYISEWENFKDYLPKGKIILNKSLPDCGASSWFLKNNEDVILAAPRISMLKCKKRDISGVYWFQSDTNYIDLKSYIQYNKSLGLPVKIIVTYDSLHLVVNALDLNTTTVVVDEMQCLISDAAFKGDTVLDITSTLKSISNIIYLSATVYEDYYLDNLDLFKDAKYIKLIWPDSITRPIQTQLIKTNNIKSTIKNIINNFKENGYFERKMIDGYPVYSKEAVFFLNSITDIIRIISALSLKEDEVNIICSSLAESKLKKIKFKRGDPPKKGDPHKTYTFVTKASFEGADFYSKSAYTYIFCDPSVKSLALDLYIDIPQIMGRQRLEENPFKYDATIFYRTSLSFYSEEEFLNYVKEKESTTKVTIDLFNNSLDPKAKDSILTLTEDAHTAVGFSKNYLTVVTNSDGTRCLHENYMVKVAETRAWQIQSQQYSSEIRILSTLRKGGISQKTNVITPNSKITKFTNEFALNDNFERKMKLYCDFRDASPEYSTMLEATTYIPLEFHQYYRILGSTFIKSHSYKEIELKKEIEFRENYISLKPIFEGLFKLNEIYSVKEIKASVQSVYDNLGIKKVAKATDLSNYFNLKSTTMRDPVTGKLTNVFQILPKQ